MNIQDQPSLEGLFPLSALSRRLLRCVPGYFHSRLRRLSIADKNARIILNTGDASKLHLYKT